MKRFILIDHEPWTIRRKQLFYDLFEKAGIQLTVWDLSQWLYPGIHNPDELTEEKYLHKINCESEFVELLRRENPSDTIFVDEIFHNWKNRKIFKYIKQSGFITIKVQLYGNTALQQSLYDKICNIKIQHIPRIINKKICNLSLYVFNKIKNISDSPQFLFSSNAIYPRTHKFNHPDYEKYKFTEQPPLIMGDYIVFCDIYFPFHTDLKFFYNLKKLPDGIEYQTKMNKYFDYLEKRYGMPVIIAAHPKAEYKGDEFGDRVIVKYKTDNLIKYSKMVTMHLCNTTSYALLNDKPIAYVVTNEYLNFLDIKRKLENLVINTLGLDYYNIDDCDFMKRFRFSKADPILRKKYIYTYLTSKETENLTNSRILYNVLSSL